MKKKLLFVVLIEFLIVSSLTAMTVRLKDIGKIVEERDNQLIGFGLVVGLRNTGDSANSLFTNKALTNMLKKQGITPENDKEFYSRNVAAVMVTADLPSFIKKGQRISIIVSSIGDSTSLVGGTLLRTHLNGQDMQTYAVAQGSLIVGGVSTTGRSLTFIKNQTTVGRIPAGAIVEKEVPVTMIDQQNITLVLDKPNFITAARTARAINQKGFLGTHAVDANTIKIPLSKSNATNLVEIVAQLENIVVEPDTSAKVVINSRTGTVVIGQEVRLMPVALTHGNISVKISETDISGFGEYGSDNESKVNISEPKNKLVYLEPKASLSSLVKALNEVGASPKDLISIVQALQESGALVAEVEIL